MVFERMLAESKTIDAKIKTLQSQLKKFPDGKLISSFDGKYSRWYQSDGHKQTYIPKKERQLAEKLALKKYWSIQLKNLLHEKQAIDFYLRHHDLNAYQEEQAFLNAPEYRELLAPHLKPLSKTLSEWMNAPYEKSKKYPENMIHQAYSGNYVRSKSEAIIDMVLCNHRIPFRYECLLELGDSFIFPDFTIRHPITGREFYWEHFGMMDNPDYSKYVPSKLHSYISNGIIPSIQLITTYETRENPLSVEMVEKIVKHYFC
ncbi:MAG: ATPase [Tyzzerella sp.]|nr:ATPase [Tyzzerella sp.]